MADFAAIVPKVILRATLSFPYFSVTQRKTSFRPSSSKSTSIIGHGNTVGIQKTLEKQIIFQRINIGNFQAVSYNRTSCRTTTRPTATPIFCRSNKILNNKKITGKSHSFDNVQLKIDAFFKFGFQIFSIPFFSTFKSKVSQITASSLIRITLSMPPKRSNPFTKFFTQHGFGVT